MNHHGFYFIESMNKALLLTCTHHYDGKFSFIVTKNCKTLISIEKKTIDFTQRIHELHQLRRNNDESIE